MRNKQFLLRTSILSLLAITAEADNGIDIGAAKNVGFAGDGTSGILSGNAHNWAVFNTDNGILTFNNAASNLSAGILINNNITGSAITAATDGGSLGSVAHAAGANPGTATFLVNANVSLTGGGNAAVTQGTNNRYDGLGAVIVNNGKTLTLKMQDNGSVRFNNTFDGSGPGLGALTLLSGGMIFGENIGANNSLATFTAYDVTIGGANTNIRVMNVGTAYTVIGHPSFTFDSSANNIAFNGNIRAPEGTVFNVGKLVVTGTGTTTFAGEIGIGGAYIFAVTVKSGTAKFTKGSVRTGGAGDGIKIAANARVIIDSAKASDIMKIVSVDGWNFLAGGTTNTIQGKGLNNVGTLQINAVDQDILFISGAGGTNTINKLITDGIASGKTVTFDNTVRIGDGGITITSYAGGSTVFTGAVTVFNNGNFDASGAEGPINFNAAAQVSGIMSTGPGIVTMIGPAALTVTGLAGVNALTVGSGGYVANDPGSDVIVVNGHAVFSLDPGSSPIYTGRDLIINAGNINTGAGDVTAGRNLTVTAGNFTSDAGAVVVNGNLSVSGTITTGTGLLTVAGNISVTNNAASPDGVSIGEGGAILSGVTVNRGDFDLTRDITGTTITRAVTMTDGDIKAGPGGLTLNDIVTFANGGVIDLGGNALTLAGDKNIIADGDSGDIITSVAGAGILNLGAAGRSYTGTILRNIGTPGSPIGLIHVIAGPTGTNTAIGGAGSVTAGVYTQATQIGAGAALAADSRENSVIYTGSVDGERDNEGTFILTNGGINNNQITVTGPIGNLAVLQNLTVDGTTLFQNTVKIGVLTINAGSTSFAAPVSGNININNAGSNVTFLSDVQGPIFALAAGVITFGTGAQTNITVTGDNGNGTGLGGAGALGAVNLNLGGGTLTLSTGKVNMTALTFRSDDTFTIGAGVAGGGMLGRITTAIGGTGSINLEAPATYTSAGDIGAPAGGNLKGLNFGLNTIFNVGNNDSIYALITGGVTVNSSGNSTFTDVGSKAAPVTEFIAAAGSTVIVDNLYAGKITNAGTIHLNDNGVISKISGRGNLILTDNAFIGPVGDAGTSAALLVMNKITGGTVEASGDIYADIVTHNGSTLKLMQDTAITGAEYRVIAPSTLEIEDKLLVLNTNLTMSSNLTLKSVLADNTETVVAVNGAAPVVNNNCILTIALRSDYAGGERAFKLFGTTGNAVVVAQTNLGTNITAEQIIFDNSNNQFTNIQYIDAQAVQHADAGTLTEGTVIVNAEESEGEDLDDGDPPDNNPEQPQPPAIFFPESQSADQPSRQDIKIEDYIDSNSIDDEIIEVICMTVNTVSQATSSAIMSAVSSHISPVKAGLASGDEDAKSGIWSQVTGGISRQKKYKTFADFKAFTSGILIGFDRMISDNTTAGILTSIMKNNIKFNNENRGDKADITSSIFGFYGNYDIGTTDFFIQGNVTAAHTKVHSASKRVITDTGIYEIVKAKYNILGAGGEVAGGYRHRFNRWDGALTAGLRYNYFGDTSYRIASNQNIKIKSDNIISVVSGVRISTKIEKHRSHIAPEAHINMSYIMNSPSTESTFKFKGTDHNFKYNPPSASRFAVNGGFSIMAESDGFEYGAGYDASFCHKYSSHQGTLKLRVIF